MKMQDDMSNSSLISSKGSATSEESPRFVLSSQNNQADEKGIAQRHDSFMTENSESEDEDVSEVDSFVIDQDYEEGPGGDGFLLSSQSLNAAGLDYSYSEVKPMASVDPQTQAKLAALLEAAGLGRFTSDGRHSDPEDIKKLTSSVSNALDEAAAALNRMRLENPDSESKTLAEACCEGQIETVRALLDKGVNIQQTSEEGESLLCFACTNGYFDLAKVLIAIKTNVEERGSKGDSTPLMCAASAGNLDIVRLLLKNGADINAQSLSGNTPLMCACAGGYEDIVRLLLSHGANIEDHNENGHTPLMEAASAGHVPIAKILLDHGAGINTHSSEFKESALTLACYKGHVDMVRFLLEAGADQEHKTDEMHTALMEASMDGHVDVARLLLDSGAQVNMPADSFESPLTLAACGGHVELAMLLLERGANIEEVNDEGYTPLMEAAREGHEEMVALLLSQDADINAQTEETQETALTLACCGGFLEVAEFLVKTGANIEAGASSPLMESAQEGHVDLVKYLIEAACNVNAATATGDTALTYACENGHTDCAVTLVEHGAFLEHESEGGRTPLMKAARSGHLCTVQFLLSQGANVNRQTTNNDHTPLSLACSGGHNTVVEYLLHNNADPNHKLKDNSTMLIEASKGGHSNIVKLLLDYPNSLHQAPPPPPPPSSTDTMTSESSIADPSIEVPRVPPHGHEVVETDGHTLSIPQVGHALPPIATSQSYLHNIQPGVDPTHFQSPIQLTGMQSSNVRPNLPSQRPSIRNVNQSAKTSISHAANNKSRSETQFPPQLYQLIKSYQAKLLGSDVGECDKISVEELSAFQSTCFDLGIGDDVDDKELYQASETIEACMNLVKTTERLNSQEELLFQKQQDLEELQRTERDCQEKAQAQFLSDAQCYFDQLAPNIPGAVHGNNSQKNSSLLFETVNSLAIGTPPPVFNRHFEEITQIDLRKNLVASSLSLPEPEALHNTTFDVPDEDVMKIVATCTASEMPSNLSVDSILEGTQNLCLASGGDCSSALYDPAIASHFSAYTKILPDDNQIALPTSPTSTIQNTSISTPGTSPGSKMNSKGKHQNVHGNLPVVTNLPGDMHSNLTGLGASSTTVSYPASLQAALVTAPNAVGSGNTVGTPTLTMATSMLSTDIGGLSQFIATESDSDAGVGGLMIASPARTLHDTLTDDTSETTNQITGTAQYNTSAFTSNQQCAQMQTAMSLATPQAYIPQTSSCTVATQCMVDPCLMGQPTESLPGSSPLPYYPSNQMPSVPQYPFDIDSQTDSNHDTALTLACAGGHEELVKLLLIRGANIEHRDKKGFTPLILAATAGHIPIVKMLVDNGADIEAQSERTKDTPLSLACSGGRYEIVEILLNRSANKEHRNVSDYTPLSLAASGGYVNIIKLLLSHGAEINSRTGSKLGISPLMLAAMNGHTPAVKLLLDMGSDINAQIETNKNTALTLACFQGRHEVVSLLVERKASIEHRAKTGLTPLMEAASGGYTDVGRVLLEKCADVNAAPVPSSKDTALTIAADKGHYRFVELLLSRGAAVDVKNKKGNSPLWLACNGGHLDVAQLLINAGAHVDSQDNRKISCLMAAFRKGHVKVVKWMVEKVTQFPADSDCSRYIATIGEEDLKSKCKECYEIIQSAKVKQAEEANKNASDLLNIINEEKNRDAIKKAAAARKREKKKLKRKEKQQAGKETVLKPEEELNNFKNENSVKNNLSLDECEAIKKATISPITPHLPPGLTLTPITGDYPPPRREEKNTVSITKIEAAVVTTSATTCSEPTVTNMGPVIVVETKSSTISLIDHCKSSKNSQPMVTISKHSNGPTTVSSSKFDSNLFCISASPAASVKQTTSSKAKSVKNDSNTSFKLAEKLTAKTKVRESKRQANKENKPAKEKPPVTSTSTTIIATITTVTTTSVTTTPGEKPVSHGKRNKKKEPSDKSHSTTKKELKDSLLTSEKSSNFNDNLIINQLSTTGIGDLDDFGCLPDSNIRSKTFKGKTIDIINSYQHDATHVDTLSDSLSMRNANSTLVNSLRPTIAVGHSSNSSASPKKGQKREDGWKEVVRKTKRLLIPPHAVSRFVGRHVSSISAIKELSGANIEIEKKDSGGDRYAVIRGSNEAVRQASNMINALIKNQDFEVFEASKAIPTLALDPLKPVIGPLAPAAKPPTKSKSPSSVSLSIYSTPPFPATSAIKQPARPGIPTTSLSNIGAPFSPVSQSWSTFISTSQSSAVSPGSRKVLGNDNTSKGQVSRQLFNDISKSVPNVTLTSISKEVASYTTAVMAPGRNTRTVTTVSTSMSAHDYKINPPLRPTNQVAPSYEKNSQFKQVVCQNGQSRMANVQQASSNSSSGSSGSPVAQDYDPFNSNFMGAHFGQNGNKSKNFASVAASGVSSLASTNTPIGSLQQTSVQSPTPPACMELQCGPVDVAKAPGYRGTGSHMSPGSNSASSGHYSAPNTPPIALIGSHNNATQRSHSSPSASSSPPIRPSSLPEHPTISEKSHQSTTATMLSTDNSVNNAPRVSSLQINSNEKHHADAIGNSSSFISNSVPSVCQPGILSVGNSVPGSSFGHPSINMVNSIGGQPRLPVMPMSNQGYPHRMVNPTHLQSFTLAPNAMNMSMASVSNGPFPSNNIVSNLNPNAPDFSSRSNNSGIMHPNIQPHLQLQHVDPSNINHQSAFRPLLPNHSFPQPASSSGYPSTTTIPRMSFVQQLPLDMIGVAADPSSFILNRQSNMNNINTNNVTYPSHDSLVDGEQHQMVVNGANKNSTSTNQTENQAVCDDRRSLPRPIGTERAYKKPPVFGGMADDKGIWSYPTDPVAPDWMSKRSYNVNNSQNMMTVNQDDSRIPPLPHVMANGTLPNYHPANAKIVPTVGADVMSMAVEPSHQMEPLYQNVGHGNQSSISSHYNNLPSGVHSNYLNTMQPNVMAAIGNQNLQSNANSINGPSNDFWMHAKLPNSATNVDSHPASVSLPDQKQVWK